MNKVHYYESHVTIDPCQESEVLRLILHVFRFKLAKLYMRKGETLEPSDIDMFMTGHDTDYDKLYCRMADLVIDLRTNGFKVRRYKIEAVMFDSRNGDTIG